MQPGASTFPCSNCGRPLPPHARFCGDCGKPVAQSQAAMPAAQPVFPSPTPAPSQVAQPVFPSPAPAQAAQPRQEDLATVVDPNFQPLSAAQLAAPPTPAVSPAAPPAPSLAGWYPTQQAARSAGFEPESAPQFGGPMSGVQAQAPIQFPSGGEFPKRRSFLATPAGKIALFFLVIAVVGGGIGIFFIVRGLGSSAAADLPGDVPLPPNSSLVKKVDQTWYYTVANTTPQQVQEFYQVQLPKNGWQEPNILGNAAGTALFACKSDQEVKIVSDAATSLGGVSPPKGGVVLKIILQPPSQVDCSL